MLLTTGFTNRGRSLVEQDSSQRDARAESPLLMRVLETDRLLLRAFRPEDLKDVIDWEEASGTHDVGAEAQAFLDFCFHEYRQRGIGPWGMELKKIGRMVGNCGFCHISDRDGCGEVNYYVAPQYRGLGLAPEAVAALLKYGFENLGLERIQARCELDNTASERVLQKLGMQFVRLLRPRLFAKPKSRLYSLTQRQAARRGPGMTA